MQRYFARLSFKGSAYAGWQVQDNAVSIQQKLNSALSDLSAEEVATTGCGRTDTGVHAKMFYAHFDLSTSITDKGKFLHQLNAILPNDIVVSEIIDVHPEAHARFDAVLRTYEYYITLKKNPFLKEFVLHAYRQPDISKMNEACNLFSELTDFSAFSKSNTQVKTSICHISHAQWREEKDLLVFTISADRFLRGMVRAVVGTMLEIGTGKLSPADIKTIAASGNRGEAGTSVAPGGLYLSAIHYPYITTPELYTFPSTI